METTITAASKTERSPVPSQGACLAQLLELLYNIDLVHCFLKLGEEVSLVPEVLAELRVFLVPTFGPCGDGMFNMHGYLGDPEGFIATDLF